MRYILEQPKEGEHIERCFLFIPRILEVCKDGSPGRTYTRRKEFRWLEYSNIIVDYWYNDYSENKRTVMYWFEEASSK